MSKAVAELMNAPTVDVETVATLFRVGTQGGYRMARQGRFGVIKLGAQYRFPSAAVREALGLAATPALTSGSADPTSVAA